MRLLVVGAAGLLGSNVVQTAIERGWDVSGTYHTTSPTFDVPLTRFDLREPDSFDKILNEHDPSVVVNCAAMTDVDSCESKPERARVINGDAPGTIARCCDAAGVSFVHVSTDYVFDGSAAEPYGETAATNPIQVYGETKRSGERAVQRHTQDALVTRLSFVWGVNRGTDRLEGFPAWVLDQFETGTGVPLFTDQRVTPTRAGQAAEAILDLVDHGASGLYHVASSSCVTPFQFGDLLRDHTGAESGLLTTASMADVDREAARPRRSCLSVEKLERQLGRPQPTLAEDVESVENLRRYT